MMRNTFGGSAIGRFARRTPSSIAAAAGGLFDALEPRQLLAVNIVTPVGPQSVNSPGSATVISLATRYDNPAITGTVVAFNSNLGTFNVEMYDQAGEARTRTTPLTVANFLNYIAQGRYINDMVHRTVENFVIQGGGFTAAPLPTLFNPVVTNPAVQNEPGNTNARGTIAMARVGGSVNSATSQWFINLANNANPLDTTDQGFTVFGRVLGSGMNVVDAIAAVPRFGFNSPFGEVPLRGYTQTDFNNERPVHTENIVGFSTIETIPELTYTVTSSNTALVQPVIAGDRLSLNYAAGMSGTANVTVHIVAADGSFTDDTFTVNVTSPTASANLAVTPSRITSATQQLTLTASGSLFENPSITSVQFYFDRNRNGVLDGTEAVDGLIDVDDTPGDGYSLSFAVQGDLFANATGGQFFIAKAFIGATALNTTTVVAATSINQAPTIGLMAGQEQNFTQSPSVVTNLGDNYEVFALNTVDRDGSVASVEFFRDANGNNTFDEGIDVSIGVDSTPNDGFGLVRSTTGFASGADTSVFARATDNEGRVGPAAAISLRVNAAPTIGTLTFSSGSITRGVAITINANNVADIDSPLQGTPQSRISKVDFFRDSNGNGTFESDQDQFFTSITVGTSGVYSLTLTGQQTAALPSGTNIFFARPDDNDFAFGAVVQASITVGNAPPTITGVTATPTPVSSLGANLTLTAVGAADSDGTVARVDFFRDANANGTFDLGVDTLLGSDNTPLNGFSIIVNTGNGAFGFTTGPNTYFAVAFDNDGTRSNNAATATGRVNAAPTIGSLTVAPNPIPRNGSYTLTAVNVADSGEQNAGGTITRVEFYLDTNNNGTLDVGTDQLLGSDTLAAGGYTFTTTTTGLSTSQDNRFFARAVDSEGGLSAAATFTAPAINSRPTITSVTALPATLAQLGGTVTLTATGAADVDGTIQSVKFYLDTDSNSQFDANIDTLLGQDSSAVGGYTLSFAATSLLGFATGVNGILAVPFDSDGAFAAIPATTTFRINAVPTIGGLSAPASVARLSTITLTATGVVDQPDSVAAGTIGAVQFFRDTNGNGTFEFGVDRLLGVGTRQGLTSTYTLTVSTTGFDTGTNTFFVRAQDNNLGFSTPDGSATTTATIVNAVPLITSVTATPNPVVTLGSTLTLTAAGQRDTDGTIASVQFFRDDGDNIFDPNTDTLLGSDSSSVGGYTLTVDTGSAPFGFTTGVNRYFARAVDNDGGFSTAVTASGRVNARPTIGSVTVPGANVTRGASVTLSAVNVVDAAESGFTGTITTVQFYLDSNNNGTIEVGDRLLGAGLRQGVTNNWNITFATTGFAVGTNTILVRATDNNTATSVLGTGVVNVDNANPTFTSTSVTPVTVAFLGQNITISPVSPRDSDGTIATVLFFLETTGDSDLQPDQNAMDHDLLLGEDSSAIGGYTFTLPTLGATGFHTGSNRVYACVIDNDGGNAALGQNFTITSANQPPAIGTVAGSNAGQATRGLTFQVQASNITDGDGNATVTRVEFYVDSNSNGTIDVGIDRLLGTAVPTNGVATLTATATGAGLELGTHTILARAQDSRLVFGPATAGTINVNNNVPTITSVTDSPDPLPNLGGNLTLTAVGAADRDGTVASVQFYRDADGSGTLDTNVDILLGTDSSAVGGYSLVVNTGNAPFGFVEGTNRYFARVIDNNGGVSSVVTTTGTVNPKPLIASTQDNNAGPVARGSNATFTAIQVLDNNQTVAGTITAVRFYRDTNGNGTIEAADRLLGVGVKQVGTDNYRLTFATTGFAAGSNTILIQATDNNGGLSVISTATLLVSNAVPIVTSGSVTASPLPFLNQNITITPVGARDTDGTIAAVDFFLETTSDNTLQPDPNTLTHDLLIGIDTSSVGGWNLVIPAFGAIGFQVGANRVYARVTDNDGGTTIVGVNFNITATNAAPTIGALAPTVSPVSRGSTTTLLASTLADADGAVSRVEFFRDTNGNGTFEAGVDRLLGTGTVAAGQATLAVVTTGFSAGTNTVFARPIDNRNGYGPVTTGTVVVNNVLPTINSLTDSPDPVINLGDNLTLTAGGVADRDGTIASVAFYYDADHNNLLDINTDILVGTDTTAVGGYSVVVNTGNPQFQITSGNTLFFARVTDNDGGVATFSTLNRINAAPGIADMEASPVPILRTGTFTVTLTGVTDDVSVTSVQIFRDTNLNNAFDSTTDTLFGSATRVGTTTTWSFTGAGTLLPVGIYKIFARARDGNGAFSGISFTVVSVSA